MKTLASYTRHVKVVVLAGTLVLTTGSAMAQQEIDPEHFDQPITANQKTRATTAYKQVATVHKTNAPSKTRSRHVAAKKNSKQQCFACLAKADEAKSGYENSGLLP